MSQIEDAINRFRESVQTHLSKSRFGHAKPATISAARRRLTIPDELAKFYELADPQSVKIPTVEGGILTLYSAKSLVTKQKGFRWNSKNGRKLPDWNDDWLVIGDEDGDPFVVDTRLKRGPHPVLRDFRNTEKWLPTRIADDLGQFLQLLTAWVDILVGEFSMKVLDKDDTLLDKVEELLAPRVEEHTDDPDLIDYWTYPV